MTQEYGNCISNSGSSFTQECTMHERRSGREECEQQQRRRLYSYLNLRHLFRKAQSVRAGHCGAHERSLRLLQRTRRRGHGERARRAGGGAHEAAHGARAGECAEHVRSMRRAAELPSFGESRGVRERRGEEKGKAKRKRAAGVLIYMYEARGRVRFGAVRCGAGSSQEGADRVLKTRSMGANA